MTAATAECRLPSPTLHHEQLLVRPRLHTRAAAWAQTLHSGHCHLPAAGRELHRAHVVLFPGVNKLSWNTIYTSAFTPRKRILEMGVSLIDAFSENLLKITAEFPGSAMARVRVWQMSPCLESPPSRHPPTPPPSARARTLTTVSLFPVELETKGKQIREDFTITERAPTRALSWLKVSTSAFTFKTLLRYYAKQMLTQG